MSMFKTFIDGFKEGFTAFGHKIVNVINFILLAFVYFIGIGLTSMIAKLFGKKFLNLKKNKKKMSYWVERNLEKQDIEDSIYRQF